MSRRGGGGGRRGGGRGKEPRDQPPAPSTSKGGGGSGRGAPSPGAHPTATTAQAQPASQASTSTPTVVTAMENLVQVPPSSSKSVKFPSRPGLGTLGMKCVVRANHFLVNVADIDLHHYDVSITPEVLSKAVTRDIMCQLVRQYRDSHLGKRLPAYDGSKSLYTAGPLPFTSKEFSVTLDNSDEPSGSARRERKFKVAIKFAAKADLQHLQQFLRSRQMDAPQETIQALDVVLREAPSRLYTVVGRSFFSSTLGQPGDLTGGVMYWRGYYQSLRPTQMGPSLNIDVSARSFYEPIIVTEFVEKYLQITASRPLSDQNRLKIKKALKGVRVEPTYRQIARRYKITGVSTQPISQLTFPDDEGTEKSVVQYFREMYRINLKHTYLPALQAGSDTRPVYLPIELCKIVEGQRYTKKLTDRQVTNMLRATCQRPHERQSSIQRTVERNNYNGNQLVSTEFGIQVSNELTSVDARVLPPPRLQYHHTGQEKQVDPRVGQWNMINKKMVNGGRVDYWTCINFSRVDPRRAHQFCQDLANMCESKGIVFNREPVTPISSPRTNDIKAALVDIYSKCAKTLSDPTKLQLLIIILPDSSGSYGTIKRVCETDLGVVSQCCKPTQVSKMNNAQYLENLSLKINVKVGGRNNVLLDAIQRRIPLVSDRPTIIFGADVTHPNPGEDSSPSIAAVVASMDWPEVTKYKGLVSAQTHREEIIEDLYRLERDQKGGTVHAGMIRELLISFHRSTKHKPERIIFYRDGVSEGQFNQVLLYEMDAIRKACASLQEGYLPPVTFVVVQKRHHTRIFPAKHGDRNTTDRSGNILPGTVIDTKICHPTEFDFYLCSHAGIQGTSRPTHYHVLFDENRFSADVLQMLTNSLCYTYVRCTRSVSIVPPAYYAHLAAFRARYYIEGEASDSGSISGGGRATRGRDAEVPALPKIKDNVKEVMFYC